MDADNNDANNDANRPSRSESKIKNAKNTLEPLQLSVTEKVIFCIDTVALSHCIDDEPLMDEILEMLHLYLRLKKKISIKPVEFQYLLIINGNNIMEIDVNECKNPRLAFLPLKTQACEDETEEFDFNLLFDVLAKKLELPDPKICNESIPPPWIYHCIFLFGRNLYIPTMKETNAFDFLIQSPFFIFDTIYIYNFLSEGSNCEQIAGALYSLYEIVNGYFFAVSHRTIDKQYGIFAQLLGHPLLRPAQSKTVFNVNELSSPDNVK